MEYNCLKIFAGKPKTSNRQIRIKYKVGKKWSVPYQITKGEKRCKFANYMDCKKANTFDDVIIDYTLRGGSYRNTFDKRLSAKVCELCGKTNIPLEIHHVNKVKNLKGKEQWKEIMIAKWCKTLAVCHEPPPYP